jgi:hypothetical protein
MARGGPQARLARPGRNVELLEATARADGVEMARAAAWRVHRTASPAVPSRLPSPRAATPLERVLTVADSGSGVSWELDMNRWLFINPELTVHWHREAAGEWICLDVQTAVSPGGAGLATSAVSDQEGPVGLAAQSLLITPRPVRPA